MPCMQNEETIASAIKASGKRREDLFITSKLAPNEASKPSDRTCWHCLVSCAQVDANGDHLGSGAVEQRVWQAFVPWGCRSLQHTPVQGLCSPTKGCC